MEPFIVQPALCLDFDGTIRYSRSGDFIQTIEDIALFDGVEERLWEYRQKGYLLLGITNQAGVAYGYRTLQQVQAEIEATLNLFQNNPFHHVQMSVLHPQGSLSPFNHSTLLRKPEIGMLAVCEAEMFKQRMIVDWENSLFVGDRPEDQECAQRASIEFVWADQFFGRSDSMKANE